ncbi:MAG: helix-turn-helix domain-containing protein [Rhodomicrobium sp.]
MTHTHNSKTSAEVDTLSQIYETLDAVEKYLKDRAPDGGSGIPENAGDAPDFASRVRGLRGKLALSQAQFARRYGLDLATLRGWEQGRRQPDTANKTLIGVIEANPAVMATLIAKSSQV